MTTAVLQTHHAVQTLPEVSPEFTQAIVQTDISGPITASDLTHTVIDKTQANLQENEIEQEDEPSSVEQTSVANSTLDGSHGGLTTELQVEGVGDKEVQAVKQTGAVIVIVNNSNNNNDIIIIIIIIPLHEKFLQFDWLRAVVFQLNLKYLHVKITNLLRVVV